MSGADPRDLRRVDLDVKSSRFLLFLSSAFFFHYHLVTYILSTNCLLAPDIRMLWDFLECMSARVLGLTSPKLSSPW